MAVEQEVAKPMSEVRPAISDKSPDDHLNHLLLTKEETWYESIRSNLHEIFHPVKLDPGEYTSKPVQVRDIWSKDENKRFSGVGSLLIHAAIIGLLIAVGTNKAVQEKAKDVVSLIAPDLAPYQPKVAPKKDTMGGGGGGGDKSMLQASKGKLPKIAPRQFVPPTAVIVNQNPKLVMEPTIVVQPNAPLPQVALNQLGNPLGVLGPPSNGIGSGGGIGSGKGGGVGSGNGVGFGPGSGAGTGGGLYRIGGGVSEPVPIYKPEPEYSEEARKAKFQGEVLLQIVIDENGHTRDVKVLRPLGLGLDEKAVEAVLKWRFRPSMKDGHAVPVQANVAVNFRLL
jgi:periplasmic protein TonB